MPGFTLSKQREVPLVMWGRVLAVSHCQEHERVSVGLRKSLFTKSWVWEKFNIDISL